MAPASRPGMPATYLLVAKDNKPIVKKAYGLANIELNVPANPDHLFTLASITKQMVAVGILKLASEDKLSLTDDIRKYFPKFDTHGKQITIEHLLTHTSGIYSETGATGANGKTLYDLSVSHGILSEEEFMDYVMQHDLYFEPGTDWGWNTYGFYMAFFIIEKISGVPFNEYMRKNIFEPAGMKNTFSKVDGNRLGQFGIKDLVSNYYHPDADGKLVWRDFRRFTPMYFYERYSIVTSLDDLMKWDIALREHKILPKKWIEKAWTPFHLKDGRSTNYGYGWVISEIYGLRVLSHVGIGTNPICTVHVPEQNLSLVCTQFYGSYEQTEVILKKILAHLLAVPFPQPSKAQAPLTDYTGVYDIYRLGLRSTPQLSDIPVYVHITTSGDTLYIQQTGGERTFLRPSGKDKFFPALSENSEYIFKRGTDGKVNAITLAGTFWTYGPEILNKRINISRPKPVIAKKLSAAQLRKFAGVYYHASLDIYRFIETDGTKLYNRFQAQMQELIPVSENRFVKKGVEDTTFEFNPNDEGILVLTIKALRRQDFRKVN